MNVALLVILLNPTVRVSPTAVIEPIVPTADRDVAELIAIDPLDVLDSNWVTIMLGPRSAVLLDPTFPRTRIHIKIAHTCRESWRETELSNYRGGRGDRGPPSIT